MDHPSSTINRDAITRNRRLVKRSIKQNSYFQFLSSDFLRLREFNRQNGIITFPFFIFMRLDQKLPERFVQQIQRNLAVPLQKALAPVLENGWRVFNKLEYNKLLYIHDFADNLAKLDPTVFKQPVSKILEKLAAIERAFFVLYSDTELLGHLERQLELYAKMGQNHRFPVDGIIRAIHMLLSSTINRLTLYSLFVALNSMAFRKFLDVKDLISDDKMQFFNGDFFELDERGRVMLHHYSQELVDSIQKHLNNHREVTLFKGLIPLDDRRGAVHDLGIIKQLYNTGNAEEDRFSRDWDNLPGFLINFSNKINQQFRRFLVSEFKIKGGEKMGQVFDKTMFTNHLSRMGYIREKLDRQLQKMPIFTRTRYLRVLSEGNLNISAAEEPVISSITELLNIYFHIARVLAQVLKYGAKAQNPESVPILRPIAFADVRFYIPYETNAQYSSVFLAGQTVRQAMSTIAKTLLLVCLELREAELVTIMRKDLHVKDTLRNLVKELKRVSTNRQFEELSDELDLSQIEEE